MKNLKKVLALVLVVATLMGFATVAGAKFTDDSSVNYKEAVDVMSEIGVINGYTDNSFRPTANVTRAQMAKMVAFIVASGEDVGNLYTSANTFTDCTNHWARGYIAYASKTGIVAGVGNAKFNPEGNVTGVQVAKMLLCALEYDATIEKFVGSDWSVNVMARAKSAGLLKGFPKNFDYSKAMTREQAALMMFNALQADVVEYSNPGSSIVVGGVEINTAASKASAVEVKDEKNTENYDRSGDKGLGTLQLCEKYFEKLVKTTKSTDAFGAKAHAWKFEKGDELVYTDEPILTYTSAVAGKDLFQDVKDAGYLMETKDSTPDEADVKTYRNHGDNSKTTTETIKNGTTKYGGNGIVINIYEDANDVIYAAVKVTYLGEVKTIVKDKTTTSADERALRVEYKDTKGVANTIELNADKTAGFEAVYGEVKVGDMLLITPEFDNSKANYALSVAEPKVETGKITSVNKSAGTVTFAGTKYDLAAVANVDKFSVSKDEVKLYVDEYGYAISSTAIGSSGDKSLAVLKAFNGLDEDGALVTKANVVMSDGIVKTIVTASASTANKVYTYTEDDGVYTLTEATNSDAKDGATLTYASTTIASGAKRIKAADNNNYYFASDVKFIFIDDGKAVVKDGVQKISTAKSGAIVLKKSSDNSLQVSTVYVLGASEVATESSDELIYVKGGSTGTVLIEDSSKTSGYETYYSYDAYINGEKVDDFYATTDNVTSGFYKNEKTDAGAYVLKNNAFTTTTGKTAVTTTDVVFGKLVNGNILSIGDNDYDVSDAVVTDLTDNDITSANDIKNMAEEGEKGNTIKLRMIFNEEDMTVDYIYVVDVTAKN